MTDTEDSDRVTSDKTGYISARATAQAAGRYVVTFADDVDDAVRDHILRSVAGVRNVTSTRDFDAQVMDLNQTAGADAVVFSRLGVAIVTADTSQLAALRSARQLLSIRPSRVYRALSDPGADILSYMRGRRDELIELYSKLAPGMDTVTDEAVTETYRDTDQFTWGLEATGVSTTRYTGRGMKVAVLDTGLDLNHPDFADRGITAQSFVSLPDPPGGLQGPQDGHGHGTHCTGTACGPDLRSSRRYGIAYQSEIFVGKVLDDEGLGEDSSIIAGIEWALANECGILSMSLGAPVPEVDDNYELIGRRALDAGALIIAAAGNNANRQFGNPGFVEVPANSPSIMAVGAIDSSLNIAAFSARSLPFDGGQVDLVGPGVAVYSSWLLPQRYHTLQGTSMATPHVSGIAALWGEATGHRGRDLWSNLTRQSRRLQLPSVDVGAGLVQAPAC